MPNPTLYQITTPNGTTYDIEDRTARQQIVGGIILKGTTTTALTDDATTNPIMIGGVSYTAVNQDAVFYGKKEFVFDGTKWHEFGDMSGLGALATKDSAQGNFTPSGSIAVNAASGSGTSYTPEGSVSAPTISVNTAGATQNITPFGSAGTLPELTMTVSDGNLTIGFSQGTLPSGGTPVAVKTGDASYSATAPSFTGTEKKFAFSGTQGNVSVS